MRFVRRVPFALLVALFVGVLLGTLLAGDHATVLAQTATPSPAALASPLATPTPPGKPPGVWTINDNILALGIWLSLLIAAGIGLLAFMRMQPRQTAPRETTDRDLEAYRISYGFWLIIAGLFVTLGVVILTLDAFKSGGTTNVSDVVAVITSVTGVIGTLTAAFFGIQAAGAGRSQAISALQDQIKSSGAPTGGYKIDPAVGPHAGNTVVTISGNGFSGATAVNFGSLPGTNFVFVNDAAIKVTSPPITLDKTQGSAQKSDRDLTVVFDSSSTQNRVVGTFYYYTMELAPKANDPNVLEFNIYGSGLAGATAVQFGDTTPVTVTGQDPNTIQIPLDAIPAAAKVNQDLEVAVVFAPDSPTKRFVVGRFKIPPTPPPAQTVAPEGGPAPTEDTTQHE